MVGTESVYHFLWGNGHPVGRPLIQLLFLFFFVAPHQPRVAKRELCKQQALVLIQALVTGKRIAERDSQQKIVVPRKAKQFKRDKHGGDGAVGHPAENRHQSNGRT